MISIGRRVVHWLNEIGMMIVPFYSKKPVSGEWEVCVNCEVSVHRQREAVGGSCRIQIAKIILTRQRTIPIEAQQYNAPANKLVVAGFDLFSAPDDRSFSAASTS